MKFIQMQWTCDDVVKGKMIAKRLIEERLAACVNMVPNVLSIYSWNGEIHEDYEFKVYIKTIDRHFKSIASIIQKHGGYETPEILSFRIDEIEEKYQEWLVEYVTVSKS